MRKEFGADFGVVGPFTLRLIIRSLRLKTDAQGAVLKFLKKV